jgi:uncharacterized protein
MLELRPCCELCGKDLPPAAKDARICSFECTFCAACVDEVLQGVCPNCGGGLYARPVRPQALLATRPASTERIVKALDTEKHAALLARYRNVPPARR